MEETRQNSIQPHRRVPQKIRVNVSRIETRGHNLVAVPTRQLPCHNDITLQLAGQQKKQGWEYENVLRTNLLLEYNSHSPYFVRPGPSTMASKSRPLVK